MGRTIDLTPTWEGILPVLVMLVQGKSEAGRVEAQKELKRMARLADKWVEHVKNEEAK